MYSGRVRVARVYIVLCVGQARGSANQSTEARGLCLLIFIWIPEYELRKVSCIPPGPGFRSLDRCFVPIHMIINFDTVRTTVIGIGHC